MKNALEGVKPGDKLKLKHRYGGGFDVHTVTRVTKTQAVCNGGSFKIDSGLMIGSGSTWNSRYATFCTDEDFVIGEQRQRIGKAQEAIRRLVVTDANVAAVEALLAPKPQQEGA